MRDGLESDASKWRQVRELRTRVTEKIEPLRRDKVIGSGLEAEITLSDLEGILGGFTHVGLKDVDLAEVFITSTVHQVAGKDGIHVAKTENRKCGRCWRYLPEVKEDGSLCARCDGVVHA
jgi:isoleucyl-tRNA synthetase